MDEYSLIILAQKGEKEAFQSLITFYYPYVSKFLLKMCGSKELSEDLTQDTFLKLIRGIENYDSGGKAAFATYLMAIAKNCYIDHLRRNRQSTFSLDEQELISTINLQDTVLDKLQMEEVLKTLNRLPPEQATAIKLKYLEQQTLQEIALKFNSKPKKIKSRIHNGTVKLRQMLNGEM
ncbi:MAG: RNA polymerase sigma factor [Eubacteriales bacterium]